MPNNNIRVRVGPFRRETVRVKGKGNVVVVGRGGPVTPTIIEGPVTIFNVEGSVTYCPGNPRRGKRGKQRPVGGGVLPGGEETYHQLPYDPYDPRQQGSPEAGLPLYKKIIFFSIGVVLSVCIGLAVKGGLNEGLNNPQEALIPSSPTIFAPVTSTPEEEQPGSEIIFKTVEEEQPGSDEDSDEDERCVTIGERDSEGKIIGTAYSAVQALAKGLGKEEKGEEVYFINVAGPDGNPSKRIEVPPLPETVHRGDKFCVFPSP